MYMVVGLSFLTQVALTMQHRNRSVWPYYHLLGLIHRVSPTTIQDN